MVYGVSMVDLQETKTIKMISGCCMTIIHQDIFFTIVCSFNFKYKERPTFLFINNVFEFVPTDGFCV